MTKRTPKREPGDLAQTAFAAVQRAIGGAPAALEFRAKDSSPAKDTRNAAAVALGRLGGSKGGKARAANLSAKERSEIARKGGLARAAARKNG